MDRLNETLKKLQEAREQHDAVLVSYSGGKDSIAVTDLCLRVFSRVELFLMCLVPGLRYDDERIAEAQKRWGLPVRTYPHINTSKFLRDGVYCDPIASVPQFSLRDLYAMAKHDAGIALVATGMKRSDSFGRRQFFANSANWTDTLYPVAGWLKSDIVAYLTLRQIPLPPSAGGNLGGIDLSQKTLLWLHRDYPDDFERLAQVFPYVGAVVARERFYGTKQATRVSSEEAPEA